MQSKTTMRYFAVWLLICLWAIAAFCQTEKAKVIVISDKKCSLCSLSQQENFLKGISQHPLSFEEIDFRTPAAQKLIKRLSLGTLPAFLAAPQDFSAWRYKKIFSFRRGYLVLKPVFSGVEVFLNRKEIPRRLDLFLDPLLPQSVNIWQAFANAQKAGWQVRAYFISPRGKKEYVEVLAAIKSLYPQKFSQQLAKILEALQKVWWESDLDSLGFDLGKIKAEVKAGRGQEYLAKTKSLVQELQIKKPAAVLINNRYIFSLANNNSGVKIDALWKKFD